MENEVIRTDKLVNFCGGCNNQVTLHKFIMFDEQEGPEEAFERRDENEGDELHSRKRFMGFCLCGNVFIYSKPELDMKENIAQLIALELRKRGNKSVRSVFWNVDSRDLSVFATSHTPEVPKSFNYVPDGDTSIGDIASHIGKKCAELNE